MKLRTGFMLLFLCSSLYEYYRFAQTDHLKYFISAKADLIILWVLASTRRDDD